MELSIKNSIINDKSLCLYCDKTFANDVDQENHVERDHKTILFKGKGSRKSERITKNNLSSENSPFPGCFHCNKKISRTDDLDTLFQHLLKSHQDVYFGCRCKIRTQDKVSLANHKNNCKISGGGRTSRCSDENVTENRKTAKKTQVIKSNGDSKCDSLSESEDNVSIAAASINSKTLPANAIHIKSDRSKSQNHSKNPSVNDKGKKNKSSSSSTISSRSSSTNRTGDDEYTIPLTRQKLKEPPTFLRLGAAQNRSSSNKKTQSQKNLKSTPVVEVKNITAITPPSTKVQRTKINKTVNVNSHNNPEPIETVLKNEPVSTEFDEDFYKNVSQNIRLNMDGYIDGKNDQLHARRVFDNIADQSSEKSLIQPAHEKEIHEATNFELSTPFPALLTTEQYGFGDPNPNKRKRQITKNSWKWRWDLIKKYKYVNEGGKIVKKVKQITTGLKDLSQLDMWTQLSMRSRYENLNSQNDMPSEISDSLSTRTIKTQNIEQLNHILDKCLTPEINIEQLQQTVIKLEPEEREELNENVETESKQIETETGQSELFQMFNLKRTNAPDSSKPMLSGEWARPRCYICVDCGLKFDLMKSLNDHKNSEHPYVVSAHYEIVGRENLEQKLYKNLFLPKKALATSGFARSLFVNSDSKSNETNEASTSSDNSSKFFADQKEKECSKCLKMIKYSSDNDIYKHILDCIEDRVWMQAKRRSKYRKSRRKNRKTNRKSRTSIDQKKTTSSPSAKDNIEGENSSLSISNPPTPKDDVKIAATVPVRASKIEPLLSETKTLNGKLNESMSIKNFFRVSKTTPVMPQKIVVQMFEIPENVQKPSLRSSLRSSSAKKSVNNSNSKNGSASKNDKPLENESLDDIVKTDQSEVSNDKGKPDKIDPVKSEEINSTKSIDEINTNLTTPLTITTPEKGTGDFPLSSPSNSSLISPTSNSNVPKKKKKLNDCIAMLTCKIQEKLGMNFFVNPQPKLLSPEIVEAKPALTEVSQSKIETSTEDSTVSLAKTVTVSNEEVQSTIIENVQALTSDEPYIQEDEKIVELKPCNQDERIVEVKPSSSFRMDSILKESSFNLPVQDEVIDLSVKKKTTSIKEVCLEATSESIDKKSALEENLKQDVKFIGLETIEPSKTERDLISVEIEVHELPSPPVAEEIKLKEKVLVIPVIKSKVNGRKKSVPIKAPEPTPMPIEKPSLTEKIQESVISTPKVNGRKNSVPIKAPEPKPMPVEEPPLTEKIQESANATPKVNGRKKPMRVAKRKVDRKKKNVDLVTENVVKKADESLEMPFQINLSEKIVEIPLVPIVCDTKPETIDAIPDKIGESLKDDKVLAVEVEIKIQIPKEEITPDDSTSFKVSIPKDKIPNLKEILDQYQVITVNNIKISESERRAFEEQKNRILQILNKNHNLARKTSNRRTPARKASKRKAPAKRAAVKRKPLSKPEPTPKIVAVEKTIAETKIEEVIKTTNKIRCRRLSVLVDPIINLSAFQNKNRKIRLTNNSQQNGFYDLLTASQHLFSDSGKSKAGATENKLNLENQPTKSDDIIVPYKEILLEPQDSLVSKAPEETVSEEKTSAENTSITEKLSEIITQNAKDAPPMCTETVTMKSPVVEDDVSSLEVSVEAEKVFTPFRKGRGKKQNVENIDIETSKVTFDQTENTSPVVEKPSMNIGSEKPKSKKKKAPAKKANKTAQPLEEIKVEQSVKDNNLKQSEKRKRPTRGKQPPKEDIIDQSSSSDTSQENDLPLSKLVMASEIKLDIAEDEKVVEAVEEKNDSLKELKEKQTKQKARKGDDQTKQLKTPKDSLKVVPVSIEVIDEPIAEPKAVVIDDAPKVEKSVEEIIPTFLSKASSSIDLTETLIEEEKKPFDPFTINEDSFFNDDMDNDPSDKINDIVNNIINSSEFQIDSDTEKSDVCQSNHDNQKSSNCTVCKRTFRNQKVYEKHCTTSTHIMKLQRKHRGSVKREGFKTSEDIKVQEQEEMNLDETEIEDEKAPSPILDEAKVFRTKGALKTFDHILNVPISVEPEKPKVVEVLNTFAKAVHEPLLKIDINSPHGNDDKLYYEFKMEKRPEDMTPKDKDQLFDSLFSSLEPKAQEKQLCYTPKSNFATATPQDSEMESSSTSWDVKQDADIEWIEEADNNVPFANAIKQRYPKKYPVKINKTKDTAVSIPTKSLIMGKIFKKHLDREKPKTPQADAPNNKPGIKNSLDEIFDHLKNTAEIDDKVLTCPSPKTLLKSAGGTFSPNSSNSNDMLETASHSNNNNSNVFRSKVSRSIPEVDEKKVKIVLNDDQKLFKDLMADEGDEGIGQRKSRRRCAIKAKTFAETWSSDEYEELHDTEDIISIINEFEKRELIKKRRMAKAESLLELTRTSDNPVKIDAAVKTTSILKTPEPSFEKKSAFVEDLSREKSEKKKSAQIQFVDEISKDDKGSNSIKKRRSSDENDGHKSDEEAFTATKDFKPLKVGSSMKKRRMSCFVPSTTTFDDVRPKSKTSAAKQNKETSKIVAETLKKFDRLQESFDQKSKLTNAKKADSEKSFKNQKKFVNLMNNFGGQNSSKKKIQKHRKRPRNKVKNIAYDSDSDFELNLNKKSKVSAVSECSSSEEDEEDDNADVIVTPKPNKSQATANASRSSSANDMTMIKEPKLLPNDLKHVVNSTTNFKAAIPEDIIDSSQKACNRTKRHSSEKLYYWSSSSSESDQEQGDTADGDNEDSKMPQQPEQHGWIVGDSHKKLVTLLAHAKIKNKIN